MTILEPNAAVNPGPGLIPGYQPQSRVETMTQRDQELLPNLALDGFDEPGFNSASWLDGPGMSMVDHPLLRGLLLELPPKSAPPSQEWMDRWFEASRAVLDLIYNRR